jgi:hypothetical protein
MRQVESYWYVSKGPDDLSMQSMHAYLNTRYNRDGLALERLLGTHLRSLWWVMRSALRPDEAHSPRGPRNEISPARRSNRPISSGHTKNPPRA